MKSIGDSAFSKCKSLEKIVIPDSVTSINRYAFKGYNNITIRAKADSYAAQFARDNDIVLEEI
jgi:hypothetical protein